MSHRVRYAAFLGVLGIVFSGAAFADRYATTLELFRNAGESGSFFADCYGYAVFPTVGRGGFIIGGSRGSGRVFVQGEHVGESTLTAITVGFQAGGQAFSQILFFKDKRAFDEFTTGQFELGAQATAVAITAGANASATTGGQTAGASGGRRDATTVGGYYRGVAVFTIAKGGLMAEASVGGQKFTFTPVADAVGATGG